MVSMTLKSVSSSEGNIVVEFWGCLLAWEGEDREGMARNEVRNRGSRNREEAGLIVSFSL